MMLDISTITNQLLNVLSVYVIFLVVFIIIRRTVFKVIVHLIVWIIILSWKNWRAENWVDLLLRKILSSRVVEVIVRHSNAWWLLRSNEATRVSIRNMLLVLVVIWRHYRGLHGKILGGTLRGSALHTLRYPTECWKWYRSAMQRRILVELLIHFIVLQLAWG